MSSVDVEHSFSSTVLFCHLFVKACRWPVCVLIAQYFTTALCRENNWCYCSVECWLLTVLKLGCVLCMPKWHENCFTEWFTLNNKTSHSPFDLYCVEWDVKLYYTITFTILYAPRGLRGCKNRPAPFPGWMSYKVTKPGLVCLIMS